MKYIDSEKLIAEIKRLLKCTELHRGLAVAEGSMQTLYWIKDFITYLQQEQEKYVIGGQVFGATDVKQLYEGKVYIVSNLVQDTEFGLSVRDKVKMLLIKD